MCSDERSSDVNVKRQGCQLAAKSGSLAKAGAVVWGAAAMSAGGHFKCMVNLSQNATRTCYQRPRSGTVGGAGTGSDGQPPSCGSSDSKGAFHAFRRSATGMPAIAPPGVPACGPSTVCSKHSIQHIEEVLRCGPLPVGPQFLKPD